MTRWLQVYLVPATVFVSVVIGGGYGTGREIVEFFSQYGLLGGLLGTGLAALIFALVLATTYEFARVFGTFEYRAFFRALIGPFWIAYEILYVLTFLLVLAVISSAAGNILEQEFGLPGELGLVAMLVLVAALVFFGRAVLEKALAAWCLLMYGVFIAYFVIIWRSGGAGAFDLLAHGTVEPGWFVGGALYPLYNVALAPVLLFSVRAIRSRGEAIGAGALAAVLTILPAMLFHLSYAVGYPEVLDQPVPNYWMIAQFGTPLLLVAFLVALFGTLAQTGAGLVQGLIERIEAMVRPGDPRGLGHLPRVAIAVGALSLSGLFGMVGIIALIGKGYSFVAVAFAAVYVVPLLTVGIYRIARQSGSVAG